MKFEKQLIAYEGDRVQNTNKSFRCFHIHVVLELVSTLFAKPNVFMLPCYQLQGCACCLVSFIRMPTVTSSIYHIMYWNVPVTNQHRCCCQVNSWYLFTVALWPWVHRQRTSSTESGPDSQFVSFLFITINLTFKVPWKPNYCID